MRWNVSKRHIMPCILVAAQALACGDSYVPPAGGDTSGPPSTSPPNTSPPNTSPPTPVITDGTLERPAPSGPAPTLNPQLVMLSYLGGQGDQHIRRLSFSSDGTLRAEGTGFSASFDPSGALVSEEGDRDSDDPERYDLRVNLPGEPGRAYDYPSLGLTFRVGYRQAGGNLQQPIFRAFSGEERQWALWGHAVADVQAASLGADSRCYQAWAMPQGRIGVQCWTDGGNSVLTKGPRDLSTSGFNPAWAAGAYQPSAGGMSSMIALVEPRDGGSVVSGTFIARHVSPLIADAWGRVYIASTGASRQGGDRIDNPFDQDASASSGLLILDPTLSQPLFNARLGGACGGEGAAQGFGVIAMHEGMLALGGTTCASNLNTVNATQPTHGGAQDGVVALIKLW